MAIDGISGSQWNYESYESAARRWFGDSDRFRYSYNTNSYNLYDFNRYNGFFDINYSSLNFFNFRQGYSRYSDYSRNYYQDYGYGYDSNYFYPRSSYNNGYSSRYDRYLSGGYYSNSTGYTSRSSGYARYSGGNSRRNTTRYTTVGTAPAVEEALRLAWQEYNRGVKEVTHNDSARITEYRGCSADRPWCASFSSWLYGRGQGSNNACTFGFTESSQAIANRADRAGHFAHLGDGYRPQVGDLMILKYADGIHGHVGIVVKVHNDGTFVTIEGNYDDHVEKVNRSMGSEDLYGFVKMNEWLQNS